MPIILPEILRPAMAAALSVMLISIAQAQQPESRKPKPRSQAETQTQPLKPVSRPKPAACAEFGPGFVRMPGSDSCIRFGGGVGIGVGAVP